MYGERLGTGIEGRIPLLHAGDLLKADQRARPHVRRMRSWNSKFGPSE